MAGEPGRSSSGGRGEPGRSSFGGEPGRGGSITRKKRKKKEKQDWFSRYKRASRDFFSPPKGHSYEELGYMPYVLAREGLKRIPGGRGRKPANIIEALGSAGTKAAVRPRATARGGKEMITGAIEAVPATRKLVKEVGAKNTGKLFLKALVEDYKRRYGDDWEKHADKDPLSNLLDVLSLAGGYARGAAFAGAAGRLGEATRTGRIAASLSHPVKTWNESSRPGRYRMVTDEEGGEKLTKVTPPGRRVRFLPPGEGTTAIEGMQAWSRSPLLRFVQEINDDVAQRFPEARVFGQRARATRAQNTTRERALKRLFASIGGTTDLEGLSKEELTRAFWGSQMGDHSAETLRAVRAALDSESGLDLPGDDAEFAEWIREARKAGFAPGLTKRLDKAIKLAEKVPEGSARYQRAVEALEEMTDVSEQVIQDGDGFNDIQRAIGRARTYLKNATDPEQVTSTQKLIDELTQRQKDEHKKFGQMFVGRRNRLREWVWSNSPVDSPERRAWAEKLAEKWGDPQMAEDALKISDRVGRRFALKGVYESPAAWYAEKVGMPTDEGAEEFMRRMDDNQAAAQYQFAPGQRTTVEGAPRYGTDLDLPNEDFFYSPLQRWVNEGMPDEMNAQVLEELLRGKTVTQAEEFYNMGLDLFFEDRPPGSVVTKEEFLDHLSSPLNAYNLNEHYYRGDVWSYESDYENPWADEWYELNPEDAPAQYERTTYGPDSMPGLASRVGQPSEYREIVMTLPDRGRDPSYALTGADHWERSNVVFHVRFQVFEEDGVRKLLIEEIQSDWESDVRKAAAEGAEYDPDITEEYRGLLQWRQDVRDEIQRLEDRFHDAEGAELDEINKQLDVLEKDMNTIAVQLSKGEAPPPPSPLGPKYYRAALRRMAREAVEENVDEIIVTDPSVQYYRNLSGHEIFWREHEKTGRRLPRHQVEQSEFEARFREDLAADKARTAETGEERQISGAWDQLYGQTFPNTLKKEYGVAPTRVENAYHGRYSAQGGAVGPEGPMPGTVIKVNDLLRQKASKAQAMYQKSPNWKELPKGATELLGDGRSAAKIFAKGDISTWIHELAHIALPDLSADERAVIEREFGAGLSMDKWKPSYHENFARAFERYLRDGEAPTPSLQPVFARIAKWISAVWSEERIKVAELHPEVKEIFDNLLASHDEAPSVFIPHRAGAPDLTGTRTASGVPRTGDVIGDRTRSRIPLFKKNRLGLVRSGMVNDDPRLLIEHMNRVVMLARANQLREAVVDIAHPLQPGTTPDFDTQYVVKPFGSKTDNVTYDALENADEPAEVSKTIEDVLNEGIGDAGRWNAWNQEGQQLYVVDKATVDMMFKYATGKTPGATTKPASTGGKVLDATLDSVRALLLYANPGFYMANIVGNSMMALFSDPRAFRDLGWSIKQGFKASSREGASSPLWRRIAVEQGRGPTSGGLSSNRKPVLGYESGWGELARHPIKSYKSKEPGALGRGAEATSGVYSSWGRKSGRIIDDIFRVAAWKQVARKHGYKTDKQIEKLLDQGIKDVRGGKGRRAKYHRGDTAAIRDLDSIRGEAEQLMLDFDSMTPFEKTWLTRAIFLYPFLKASAKWPLQYAGQRPITTGVLGQLALVGQDFANEQLGERPELPAWMDEYARVPGGGFINAGSFAPQSAALNMLTSLTELDEEPVLGISGPLDYLNPGVQWAIQVASGRNTFGRGAPRHKLLYEEAPLTSLQRQLLGIRDPSIMFQDRDLYHSLLRSLRVVPTRVNVREAKKRAKAEKKATK